MNEEFKISQSIGQQNTSIDFIVLQTQFHTFYMISLAIVNLFLIINFLIIICWKNKKNLVLDILCRKILRKNKNVKQSTGIPINVKWGELIKPENNFNTNEILDKNDQQSFSLETWKALNSLSSVFTQQLKQYSLQNEFLSVSMISNTRFMDYLLTASYLESLTIYQPFFVLCLMILSLGDHIIHEDQQKIKTKNNFQLYAVIAMLITSFIIYLCLNCSNVYVKIMKKVSSPKKKIQNELINQNTQNKMNAINTQSSSTNTGISSKFANDVNLLRIIYLIPLVVSLIVLIYEKF